MRFAFQLDQEVSVIRRRGKMKNGVVSRRRKLGDQNVYTVLYHDDSASVDIHEDKLRPMNQEALNVD